MRGLKSKANVAAIVEVILGFFITFLFYSKIPNMVPIHWDINMEPNGYMQKPWGAFFTPLMNLALFFVFLLLPKIDPKKQNYKDFRKSYDIIRILIHTMALFIQVLIILWSLRLGLNFALLGQIFGCIVFIILGNYLSTVKFNYFVGVRTPWTLASESAWKKTHRMMGYTCVILSLIGLVLAFILSSAFWGKIMMIALVAWVILGFVYSYLVFSKGEK